MNSTKGKAPMKRNEEIQVIIGNIMLLFPKESDLHGWKHSSAIVNMPTPKAHAAYTALWAGSYIS